MKLAKFIGAAAIAALTGVGPTAQAATITTLFNTGVGPSGTPLADNTSPDPHYTLVYTPPNGAASPVLVRTSAGGFPIPPYLPDNSVSAWIGPNFAHDLTGPAGGYDYQTTFNLTGFDLSTVVITGRWSSDNAGLAIGLNSNDTGASGNPYSGPDGFSYEHWVSFVITNGFIAGPNTLDFIVLNGNGGVDQSGPTALRVEMTGTAIATPLPSTWTMMLVGFAGLGFLLYRRAGQGNAASMAAA